MKRLTTTQKLKIIINQIADKITPTLSKVDYYKEYNAKMRNWVKRYPIPLCDYINFSVQTYKKYGFTIRIESDYIYIYNNKISYQFAKNMLLTIQQRFNKLK